MQGNPDFHAVEQAVHQRLGADDPEGAEALARAALGPSGAGPVPLLAMLGSAVRQQGRIAEAREIQRALVEAVPGNLGLRFDLAETLLLLGEFERGWREYHYRYSLPHTRAIERKVRRPRWDGRRLEGRVLLIHDEQGYGDTFQFLRLVPRAKERSGARVVLEVGPEALPFARRMTGIDAVIPRGQLPPPFDVHCEMMSLPMALGLGLADLPGPLPYLASDPGRRARWRKRLDKLARPLVALVWAGRPSHPNDRNRSMRLADLAPLAGSGATFLAIQMGPAASEAAAPPAGMTLVNLGDAIRDFDDTAAILEAADLLISVDSSPVHLAGALGASAWVLLPFVPDWRWLTAREDSPWYPSLRLFRQPARGDWAAVTARVAGELTVLCRR